jgi:hypothetical protein
MLEQEPFQLNFIMPFLRVTTQSFTGEVTSVKRGSLHGLKSTGTSVKARSLIPLTARRFVKSATVARNFVPDL